MRYRSLALCTTLGILSAATSQAAEPFKSERISVEKNISPGPNVFVLHQNWKGQAPLPCFQPMTFQPKEISLTA